MQHMFKNIKFIYVHGKTVHILYKVTRRDNTQEFTVVLYCYPTLLMLFELGNAYFPPLKIFKAQFPKGNDTTCFSA